MVADKINAPKESNNTNQLFNLNSQIVNINNPKITQYIKTGIGKGNLIIKSTKIAPNISMIINKKNFLIIF